MGVATFINLSSPKIYESGSYVFVSTPAAGLDISTLLVGSTFSESRVKSYAEIMTSPNTLQPVIDKLKLGMTPQELARNVRTVAPLDTVLLQIFVSDVNPLKAATVANAIARQQSIEIRRGDAQIIQRH
jgi:non-specific protein-tyrosine kinase